MRTRAAVALEAGKPLEVMEVELDGPRAGEVLIEVKATGLCHTDEFTRSGDDPEGIFPAILVTIEIWQSSVEINSFFFEFIRCIAFIAFIEIVLLISFYSISSKGVMRPTPAA